MDHCTTQVLYLFYVQGPPGKTIRGPPGVPVGPHELRDLFNQTQLPNTCLCNEALVKQFINEMMHKVVAAYLGPYQVNYINIETVFDILITAYYFDIYIRVPLYNDLGLAEKMK